MNCMWAECLTTHAGKKANKIHSHYLSAYSNYLLPPKVWEHFRCSRKYFFFYIPFMSSPSRVSVKVKCWLVNKTKWKPLLGLFHKLMIARKGIWQGEKGSQYRIMFKALLIVFIYDSRWSLGWINAFSTLLWWALAISVEDQPLNLLVISNCHLQIEKVYRLYYIFKNGFPYSAMRIQVPFNYRCMYKTVRQQYTEMMQILSLTLRWKWCWDHLNSIDEFHSLCKNKKSF